MIDRDNRFSLRLLKKLVYGGLIGFIANVVGYSLVSLFVHYRTNIDLAVDGVPQLMGATYFNSVFSEVQVIRGSNLVDETLTLYNSRPDIYSEYVGVYEVFGMSAEAGIQDITTFSGALETGTIYITPMILTAMSALILCHYLNRSDRYADAVLSSCSIAVGFLLFALVGSQIFDSSSPEVYTGPSGYQYEKVGVFIDILQPEVLLPWILYPLAVGVIVGTAYHCLLNIRKESSRKDRYVGVVLLLLSSVTLLLFVYNAAILPGYGEFGDNKPIPLDDNMMVNYITNSSDNAVTVAFYTSGYVNTELSIDGRTTSGKSYYEISRNEFESADSAVARFSIDSRTREYNLLSNSHFTRLNGSKTAVTSQSYTYRLENTPENLDEVIFLIEGHDGWSSTSFHYNGTAITGKSVDDDLQVEMLNISKRSITLRYTGSGEYDVHALTSHRGQNAPNSLYSSDTISVNATSPTTDSNSTNG